MPTITKGQENAASWAEKFLTDIIEGRITPPVHMFKQDANVRTQANV